MKFTFDSSALSKRMKRLENQISKKRSLLEDIAKEEVTQAQNRIRLTKTDPDGKPWAPWSYATMMDKKKKSLLYRSGRMFRSFRVQVTNTKVTITNAAPYAQYHQNGTQNMPARPFLGWSSRSLKSIQRKFAQHLRK